MKHAALGIVLALLAPAALAAPWLQPHHDAAATSATLDPGPAWNDVALRLPFFMPWEGTVILDGMIYLAAVADYAAPPTLVRVDPATGAVEELAELPVRFGFWGALASDGRALYFAATDGSVHAYGLDGGPLWSWPGPSSGVPTVDGAIAASLQIMGDQIFAGGSRLVLDDHGGSGAYSSVAHLASLDAATGELQWLWRDEAADLPAAVPLPPQLADVARGHGSTLSGLSATPTAVVATVLRGAIHSGAGGAVMAAVGELRGMDPATGDLLWRAEPSVPHAWAYSGGEEVARFPQEPSAWSRPAAREGTVFALWDGLTAFNLATGEPLWNATVGAEDLSDVLTPSGPAVSEEHVYAASITTAYAFPRAGPAPVWRHVVEEGRFGFFGTPIATRDRLYLQTCGLDDGGCGTMALDRHTGERVWWWREGLVPAAVGDGMLVAFHVIGDELGVAVVGTTAASPALEPRASETYPAVGETVRLDLSRTRAGLQGEVSEYRVEWGDGADTGWVREPVLSHAYAEAGERVARAHVRNAAGQSASVAIPLHPGMPKPNLLEVAFRQENQDTTFFALGLLATAIGGGIGLLRVQRRRGRLAAELRELEEAVQRVASDAPALDRLLDERRVRARALLLGRKLDEGQHAVLTARIQELSRERRLDLVQRDLDFLPHRHVRLLQEMLTDGRISSIEREHYLAMLDADATLTREYKARVRAIVEQWAMHDGATRR